MSTVVVFSIGAVVFAITVVGCVMAGGLWFTRLAGLEDVPIGGNLDADSSGAGESGHE